MAVATLRIVELYRGAVWVDLVIDYDRLYVAELRWGNDSTVPMTATIEQGDRVATRTAQPGESGEVGFPRGRFSFRQTPDDPLEAIADFRLNVRAG